MNRKLWIQKALSLCSLTAVSVVFSMIALAGAPIAGELTVSGSSSAAVTVNGEPADSGRAISASSTIVTPEGKTAVVSYGKLGRIQLSPSTTFSVNANDNGLSGSLTAGSITVLNAAKGVSVTNLNGEAMTVNAGETASASASSTQTKTTATTGNNKWWVFALVAGGATAAILLAATNGGDSQFGAGATTVSPTR